MVRQKTILGLLLAIVLLLPVTVALAQVGGPYDLTWSTIDGGGYISSAAGSYTVGGTIGQADAGLLASGDYTLGGGFWGGGAQVAVMHQIYLPLVTRN